MGEALVFGLTATSGLVLGPLVGLKWRLPRPLVATLLAFASGALIAALSFELFEVSFRQGGAVPASVGLLAGAGVFVLFKELIRHYSRKSGDRQTGLELLASVTLDGVPENLALGITLAGAGTGSPALLVAIFISNFPEALVGTENMRRASSSRKFILSVWVGAAVLLTAAVLCGDFFLKKADPGVQALCLALAGGAVLASLADTLMPAAYREGGSAVAFATAAGFLLAFLLSL